MYRNDPFMRAMLLFISQFEDKVFTDPRDKVFAVTNLLSESRHTGTIMKPYYIKTVLQVISESTKCLILESRYLKSKCNAFPPECRNVTDVM